MIRSIRDLLYEQGFTISGARNKMQETHHPTRDDGVGAEVTLEEIDVIEIIEMNDVDCADIKSNDTFAVTSDSMLLVRRELFEIRALLSLVH
jgi:hypothetical protein